MLRNHAVSKDKITNDETGISIEDLLDLSGMCDVAKIFMYDLISIVINNFV